MLNERRKQYIKEWKTKHKARLKVLRQERNKLPEVRKRLAEAVKRYRQKPGIKEKERVRQSEYRAKLKQLIFNYYGDKCNCCGEGNSYFLSIDHIFNDGNKDKRRKDGKRFGGRMLYHKIIKENFPNRYQILCMNCNFGKAKNGGVCPHKNLIKQHG